jgi:ABC-type uncharacterized transport system involved in gliding motility auxiliary subunit
MKRIFDLLGWLGVALVGAAFALRFSPVGRLLGESGPDPQRVGTWLAWSGLACVLLYTAGQWRDIRTSFQRRQTRYGAVASASVLIVIGILVAVNYLSARQNKRWDLTANQQFSLSDQTVQLLRKLDAPVKFLVFDQEANFDRFRGRLTEYEYHSDKVDVEYIDADKRPMQAKQYEIQSYGTVVVEYKDRRERVNPSNEQNVEQDLTNALIKVLTGTQKKVYFVQGHGEKSHSSSERDGYNTIAAALGRDNYAVEPLVLAQQKEVPPDASVVVVAGPKTDLLQGEADMLRRYLAKGGHVLFLVDPPDAGGPGTPVVDALLKEWAVEPGRNIVVDVSGMGQLIGTDASVPVAASYPTHPITERFNVLTAYPLARSITPVSGGVDGRFAQTFVETSPRSWAETNISQLGSNTEVALNEDQGDKPGPVSIAVAVSAPATDAPATVGDAAKAAQGEEPKKPEARVAVIGDSDFAANFALGIQGNRDLFLNAVNWLAQQENLIAIRPKQADDRRITMTADQHRFVQWLSLLLVPAAVLGAGIYTWSSRRRK